MKAATNIDLEELVPVAPPEDELTPVKSSKTSGPLMRVTSGGPPPARAVPAPGSQEPLPEGLVYTGDGIAPKIPVGGGYATAGIPLEAQPDVRNLNMDENRGALSAHGYRLVLMRPEVVIEIQNALEEKIGLEAGQILFRGGYAIGLKEAKRQKLAELEAEEILEGIAKRCSAQGWGIFEIETLDLWRHELVFRVDHSPFAYAYGKSDTGVDHLIRGVFAGACEVLFEKKVVATEALCRSMGDDFCRFMVG